VQDTILNNSEPVAGGTPDGSTDVVLKGAVYHQPWTIVRILRSIFTGDEEDVPIVVNNFFSIISAFCYF
jgi:hypothetical protein